MAMMISRTKNTLKGHLQSALHTRKEIHPLNKTDSLRLPQNL